MFRYRRRRIFRRRRRFYRRRRYGRRFRRHRANRFPRGMVRYRTTIRKMPYLMPDSLKMTMKFTETVQPVDQLGSFVGIYRMNNPYEPFASSGVSVLGWAEFSQFYDRYYCSGSKIRLQFFNSNVDTGIIACYPSNDAAAVSGIDRALELPYVKSTISQSASVPHQMTTIKNSMSVRKWLGWPPFDTNYTASVTGDPTSQFYWVYQGDMTDGEVSDLFVRVTIWYNVRFYKRVALAASTH